MTAADRLAEIRANADAADRIYLPHLHPLDLRMIDRARKRAVTDVRDLVSALDAVLALPAESDTDEAPINLDHDQAFAWSNGHDAAIAKVRAAITDALGSGA